eukprot:UN04332
MDIQHNYTEMSSLSLQSMFSISVFGLLVHIVSLLMLYYHFQENSVHFIIKISSYVALLSATAITVYFGIINNNSVVSSFNDNYKFIEKYCAVSVIISVVIRNVNAFCLLTFFKSQIYFFFQSTPHSLSRKRYLIWIIIYFVFCISCIQLQCSMFVPMMFHAMDNKNNKKCVGVPDANASGSWLMFYFIFNVFEAFQLYELAKKTNQLDTLKSNLSS